MNYMEKNKEIKVSFKKWIFFPPWLLLVALVVISLWNEEKFLDGMHFVIKYMKKTRLVLFLQNHI